MKLADERSKALATALEQIEKQYGKGTIMKLGENAHMNVDSVSTGSIGLDAALQRAAVLDGLDARIGGHRVFGVRAAGAAGRGVGI